MDDDRFELGLEGVVRVGLKGDVGQGEISELGYVSSFLHSPPMREGTKLTNHV